MPRISADAMLLLVTTSDRTLLRIAEPAGKRRVGSFYEEYHHEAADVHPGDLAAYRPIGWPVPAAEFPVLSPGGVSGFRASLDRS